jgi:hypothetical protein
VEYAFVKIEVYCPPEAVTSVRDALNEAGAGHIGSYDHCASAVEVVGWWRPLEGARPYEGSVGEISEAREIKLEMRCPASQVAAAVAAIRRVHPYEEPVMNIIPLLVP